MKNQQFNGVVARCIVPSEPVALDLGRVIDVRVLVADRAVLSLPFAPWRPVPAAWTDVGPTPRTGPLAGAESVTGRCAWAGRPWGPTNRPGMAALLAPAGGSVPVAAVAIGVGAEPAFRDALDFAVFAADCALAEPEDVLLDVTTPDGGRVILDAENDRGQRRRLCTAAIDPFNGCACAREAQAGVDE